TRVVGGDPPRHVSGQAVQRRAVVEVDGHRVPAALELERAAGDPVRPRHERIRAPHQPALTVAVGFTAQQTATVDLDLADAAADVGTQFDTCGVRREVDRRGHRRHGSASCAGGATWSSTVSISDGCSYGRRAISATTTAASTGGTGCGSGQYTDAAAP